MRFPAFCVKIPKLRPPTSELRIYFTTALLRVEMPLTKVFDTLLTKVGTTP
jgi:hypothetical protein